MLIALFIISVFAWWLCGVSGFLYWWGSEHKTNIDDLFFSFFIGFMGPIAWISGYYIHCK